MARVILQGLGISPGIAIGPLLLLPESGIGERRPINAEAVEAEIRAIQEASAKVCAALAKATENLPKDLADYREIIATQQELARDPRILDGAAGRIRHKKICATWAIEDTIAELSQLFQDMADPYLRDMAQDIRAMGKCLINALPGNGNDAADIERGILAADDISPATFLDFRPEGITGLITIEGGATSHTAILARALKVPAVIGVPSLRQEARKGETVIVDGFSGQVLFAPDAEEIARYARVGDKHTSFEREARAAAHQPAITRDGRRVQVLANLENCRELGDLSTSGAEGIGLYRTEFAWLGNELPTEAGLVEEYRSVLAAAPRKSANGSKNVIFRVLDVGADKLPIRATPQEPNPALGLRGIRFCFHHPHLFRTQLRALLRAGLGSPLAIMLPMVTTLDEVRSTRALLDEIASELDVQGLPHAARPSLGVMLETPAAVFICDQLARECDFISIGTNDLIHYMMAIDRCNMHVSYLHDPLHTSFIRAIRQITSTAHASGRKVSVCGELAADPLGIALLLGLGVDILSVTSHFVPGVKHLLRQLSAAACGQIVQDALVGADPHATRQRFREMLAQSMGGELLLTSVMP